MPIQLDVDERTVVDCWERQSFPTLSLEALDCSVVFRGMPSDAGGPDYQDAILAIGGRAVVGGDIEFHVRSSDWYRHGHHLNPAYNRVILHVVWTDDGTSTLRTDGSVVPVLAVGDQQRLGLPTSRHLLPHPCIQSFAAFDTEPLLLAIHEFGLERFRARADTFAADVSALGCDEVAYRALLEALGYSANRAAFRALAEAVPYAWLMSLPSADRAASLLDAARLAPAARVRPPARIDPDLWRLSRLRPANHPARRIHGAVTLLSRAERSIGAGLVEWVQRSEHPSDLRRRLVVPATDGAFIGAGRADELAVSVVLPLVAVLEPSDGRAAWLFQHYPSPPDTRWTRHMLHLMQSAGHEIPRARGAPQHQGLHHLYHSHCRRGPSGQCALCQPLHQ